MRRVQVYRNMHKSYEDHAVYSIRDKKTRLVFSHQSYLLLGNCKFHVSPTGRERVLREKRKNVHAWIEGDAVVFGPGVCDVLRAILAGCVDTALEGVRYNPYRHDQFQRALGGPAPEGCSVIFTPYSVSIITSSIK